MLSQVLLQFQVDCMATKVSLEFFVMTIEPYCWLVVEQTHLKNMSQIGNLSQVGVIFLKN